MIDSALSIIHYGEAEVNNAQIVVPAGYSLESEFLDIPTPRRFMEAG
jgi:hypothetical protein